MSTRKAVAALVLIALLAMTLSSAVVSQVGTGFITKTYDLSPYTNINIVKAGRTDSARFLQDSLPSGTVDTTNGVSVYGATSMILMARDSVSRFGGSAIHVLGTGRLQWSWDGTNWSDITSFLGGSADSTGYNAATIQSQIVFSDSLDGAAGAVINLTNVGRYNSAYFFADPVAGWFYQGTIIRTALNTAPGGWAVMHYHAFYGTSGASGVTDPPAIIKARYARAIVTVATEAAKVMYSLRMKLVVTYSSEARISDIQGTPFYPSKN